MALRNLGCFLRLNVNMHEGFHFYNLAVMTLVRNKLTWEYSRLSSLPPLGTFCARSSLSKNVSSGVDWRLRDRRLYSQVGIGLILFTLVIFWRRSRYFKNIEA